MIAAVVRQRKVRDWPKPQQAGEEEWDCTRWWQLHIQDHLVRHAIGVQHLGRFLLLGCRWLIWKRLLQKHAQVAQRKLPCSWYALQWLYQAQQRQREVRDWPKPQQAGEEEWDCTRWWQLHIQDHLVRHAIGVQHLGRFLLLGCRWLIWKRLL